MKTRRRTEITVETHRIMVIRAPHRLDEGWCERCGKQAARISLQAATQVGISAEAISRHVDEGRLHFTNSNDGLSFICLAASTTQERKLLQ
jgi:hypothetical protein